MMLITSGLFVRLFLFLLERMARYPTAENGDVAV